MDSKRRAQLSFVVPTLNSASTLDATLSTLRAQQGVDVNVLVADSGSTDGTLEICKRWDVPTIYVPPGNMYAAINAGLRECQTEWLGYLNSDDWIYANSLLRLTDRGEAVGADVVYGSCDYSDGFGRFVFSFAPAKPTQLDALFRLGIMGFAQPAALFRRSLYQKLGGFDERFTQAADSEFYMRAVLTRARFALLKGPPVASFRLHSAQQSYVHSDRVKAEDRAIRERTGQAPRIWDYVTLMEWRLGNVPHYLIRLLRNGRFHRHHLPGPAVGNSRQ